MPALQESTPVEAEQKDLHLGMRNPESLAGTYPAYLSWVTVNREIYTSTVQNKQSFHIHITFYDLENLLQSSCYLTCLLLLELVLILRINRIINC